LCAEGSTAIPIVLNIKLLYDLIPG